MKSIIRKDEAAVSPVIATILMVAITVVLAAVLYVMVSVPSGLTVTGTKLTVITGGGATSLAAKAFGSLVYATDHAGYVQAVSGSAVGVGDRLLLSRTSFPTGYTYQISDGTSILASGTLQ